MTGRSLCASSGQSGTTPGDPIGGFGLKRLQSGMGLNVGEQTGDRIQNGASTEGAGDARFGVIDPGGHPLPRRGFVAEFPDFRDPVDGDIDPFRLFG